ncbi:MULTISPECIES: hypothetical protein [Saccharothrix]|uniref:hypothetical protein n=1 Tax=Saccharothrix TaxID=2071 RepID=UPI0013010291|nr:hypothetical protein [Saccharothrix sp. CB00851]
MRTRSADQVESRSDTDCDGTSETVPRIGVPAEGAVDVPPTHCPPNHQEPMT